MHIAHTKQIEKGRNIMADEFVDEVSEEEITAPTVVPEADKLFDSSFSELTQPKPVAAPAPTAAPVVAALPIVRQPEEAAANIKKIEQNITGKIEAAEAAAAEDAEVEAEKEVEEEEVEEEEDPEDPEDPEEPI